MYQTLGMTWGWDGHLYSIAPIHVSILIYIYSTSNIYTVSIVSIDYTHVHVQERLLCFEATDQKKGHAREFNLYKGLLVTYV